MICKNCGQENNENNNFCTYCGQILKQSTDVVVVKRRPQFIPQLNSPKPRIEVKPINDGTQIENSINDKEVKIPSFYYTADLTPEEEDAIKQEQKKIEAKKVEPKKEDFKKEEPIKQESKINFIEVPPEEANNKLKRKNIVEVQHTNTTEIPSQYINTNKPTEENKSRWDGKLIQIIGWYILVSLLNAITLGIYVPWGYCKIHKWQCKHTVVDGKRLVFNGTGGSLIGSYIKWIFLTIITLGIYAFFIPKQFESWRVKHTHFAEENK